MAYYENYPPGVTSIPGDFDKTVSYRIIFPYFIDPDNVDDPNDINNILNEIKSYTGVQDILIADEDIKRSSDNMLMIYLIYEDDIEADLRYADPYDVEQMIIDHTNDVIMDANIDPNDIFDLDYNIH